MRDSAAKLAVLLLMTADSGNGDADGSTLHLPPDPSAVRTARRFAREIVEARLGEGAVDIEVLSLLVSELASNAILHAGTDFEVWVRIGSDAVRVDVIDGSDTLPMMKIHSGTAPSGRGLRIVDASASRWGAERLKAGKSVWFEVLVVTVGTRAEG